MYQRLNNNLHKYTPDCVGIYQFPIIRHVESISLLQAIPFNYVLSSKEFGFGVHFFIDDYQFERLWTYPERYIEILKKYQYVLSPDFSLYTNMPKAMQIWNRYRSQWIGSYLQHHGVCVIPTISWSDESSFEWVFDGVEKNSIVAVSSVGCLKTSQDKISFIKGYNTMIETIKPKLVLFYGRAPEGIIKTQIYEIESYQTKFTKAEDH